MDAATMLGMARRRAQLSQRELGRRSGVPQATISRIENRVVSPTLDTLEPLIRACGMQLRPVEQRGAGVDRSQIRERLLLSPTQRLRLAVDAANGLRELRRTFGVGQDA
ncbi:MAG: helix-turn-helix transcriptional regulator [Actinobacteria bacterium]|nr:helix-turn-helix transcriptional regulator [Actinomycetota bacterium]MDQ3209791.1 helix-turn-helix transcriptional regulator [Actinomycetota bacterium]